MDGSAKEGVGEAGGVGGVLLWCCRFLEEWEVILREIVYDIYRSMEGGRSVCTKLFRGAGLGIRVLMQ